MNKHPEIFLIFYRGGLRIFKHLPGTPQAPPMASRAAPMAFRYLASSAVHKHVPRPAEQGPSDILMASQTRTPNNSSGFQGSPHTSLVIMMPLNTSAFGKIHAWRPAKASAAPVRCSSPGAHHPRMPATAGLAAELVGRKSRINPLSS